MNPEHERPADIMVVDDTPANLQLLEGLLRERGYHVRALPRGRLALAAAEAEPPDLILLDINMPEMNGYEVCERLRAHPQLKDIPVLFISALNETLDKVKAFALGGLDYITKPFQIEEVEARVRTHLELRRQQRQLRESYLRLQELERLRDGLMHMVVHDMYSPLFAILGFLNLLAMELSSKLSKTELKWLIGTRQRAMELTEMVTTLLDVSRLEAGQMPLDRSAVDLAAAAREVVASLASLAEGRRLSIDSPTGPVMADGDPGIIRRVIANLVGNALKFTPEDGEVRIAVEQKEGLARLAVSDTGRGIPPEYHAKIFEKFAQVDKQQRQYSTGLGLTFCKLAVEAHGGQVGVQSQVGQGSTFWFVLPPA
jgi:signal transduction histidine kinase